MVSDADEEYGNLVKAAAHHLKPIIVMAWQTGMIKGEIENLKWMQVELKSGYIHVSTKDTKTCSVH